MRLLSFWILSIALYFKEQNVSHLDLFPFSGEGMGLALFNIPNRAEICHRLA
jgi:hypothetical protein